MDTTRLRAAAGDVARNAQSYVRHAAADPDMALDQLVKVVHVAELDFEEDDTAYGLRAAAREHVLWAVAFMDAARRAEAAGVQTTEDRMIQAHDDPAGGEA